MQNSHSLLLSSLKWPFEGTLRGPNHPKMGHASQQIAWPNVPTSGPFGPSDVLFRGQTLLVNMVKGVKGVSLLIKLSLWRLLKGPSGPEMGQWCISSNGRPVCTVWNQIWCHKDFQRGKSTLYGVIVILTRFPLYCGSICALWNHYPIKMMQQRPTQKCSNHYSDFIHWFGLAFSDIRYFPLWGSI